MDAFVFDDDGNGSGVVSMEYRTSNLRALDNDNEDGCGSNHLPPHTSISVPILQIRRIWDRHAVMDDVDDDTNDDDDVLVTLVSF